MRKYGALWSIFLALLLLLSGCSNPQKKKTGEEATSKTSTEQTIKIGVLADLSGSLSTIGTDIKNAASIAKEQVNKFFKSKGYPYKVEIYVEDTQINPSICLKKVQAFKAKGVNLAVGPMASSEVKNISNYLTANKMIIISPSSTALPSLLGFTKPEEKKYIFRFVPNDAFQGKAIASVIKSLGYKKVLVIFREDAWGRGLENAAVDNLKKLGIKILGEIGYPSTPEPSDWSPYIEKMTKLAKGNSPQDTAILAITFEEVATLLSQIKDNSPLLSYKWFGSDGSVDSSKVLEEAKDKAIKIKLYSTIFYSVSPSAKALKEEYEKKGYGKEITQYALNSYDAIWVLAKSYIDMLKATGKYNADVLVKEIRKNVKEYSKGVWGVKPVTGPIVLNEWNDRASGNYAIHIVTPEGWKTAGIWDSTTGKVAWTIKQ